MAMITCRPGVLQYVKDIHMVQTTTRISNKRITKNRSIRLLVTFYNKMPKYAARMNNVHCTCT